MKNFHKIIISVFFFFVIAFIPIISLITMPRERLAFSENENRYLARFPLLSFDRVVDASFMKGFEDWANDRVFGRESWIKLKHASERTIGKLEIGGTYTADNRIMQAWNEYNEASVNRNLAAMNAFAKRHGDVPVYLMIAPSSIEIYRDSLPRSVPVGSQKDFIKYCYDELTELTSVDVLYLMEEFSDGYIYYRTDHHWTSEGAYIAYTALGGAMNFTPLGLNSFDVENASNSFRGTLFSRTLDEKITPDIIKFYTLYDGDPDVLLKVNNGMDVSEHDSLYFREYLEVKDKYSAFLGTQVPVVNIYTDIPGSSKRLLIFKDSYAHSLVPFLTKNFNEITMVDLRFINTRYSDVINVDKYDAVLFIYNAITFSEDTNLIKLGRE
ncbi:MAG: DHHW family protein [Oscillospiraceae bacterium]|nr:DHHW family protein [Oscillospiraceae bacterium]